MSRSCLRALAPAVALIGALSGVSPASATDTSFASYTNSQTSFIAKQQGGSLSVTESGPVTFSFLNTSLASVIANVSATLTLSASGFDSDYSVLGPLAFQDNISGSYSFKSTQAYTIGNTTYAANSNLLTITFVGASLFGKLTSADALFTGDSGVGNSVTYTSDFLTFNNTISRDFSISLGAIAPTLSGTTSLNSFTATPVGSFASDPVPSSNAVLPEPASWAMMLVGFGAIGLGVRGATRRALRAS